MRPFDADEINIPEYKGSVKRVLMQAPTIDAVTVVRCKECKYSYTNFPTYACTNRAGLCRPTPDSFCSYGERKDDESQRIHREIPERA